MVRKRKKREDEQPPWCYYCDRVFSDEQTLVQHQKAKHFKCTVCHKRLTSAGGLRVHCHQVHRFALEKVPFAKPGKESMDVEVFGMAGVPEGAVPGAPPPDEEEPDAQTALAAKPLILPPAPLPPPGSQPTRLPILAAPGQPQYMLPPIRLVHGNAASPVPSRATRPTHPWQQPFPGNMMQPMQGPPQFAPPGFLGMPPPFMRPPPGVLPPPGFQMPGMPPQAATGPGPFQQQPPPLFPAGAAPPAQGQPLFPINQGASLSGAFQHAPAAAPNMNGPAPQGQPVFPIGQDGPPTLGAPAAEQNGSYLVNQQQQQQPFQQQPFQAPPLFPAGAAQPAQGQPVFPISQAPASGHPQGQSQSQPTFPIGQGAAFGNPQDQPQGQPMFPIDQGAAPALPPGPGPALSAGVGPQQPPLPLPNFPVVQPGDPGAPSAPGQHMVPEQPMMQQQPAGFPGQYGQPGQPTPQPQYTPSPAPGYRTPNGSVHMTPSTPLFTAPTFDDTNSAVVWKAVDFSMEEIRAQHPRYVQKLNRAAGYM